MPLTRKQAVALIKECLPDSPTRKIIKQLTPCTSILLNKEKMHTHGPYGSYFGGTPCLPVGIDWPRWDHQPSFKRIRDEAHELLANNPDDRDVPEQITHATEMLSRPDLPLAFLCQINLASVQQACKVPDLPKSGILQCYYEIEKDLWPLDPCDSGGFRVLYFPPGTDLTPAKVPVDLKEAHCFEPHAISFDQFWSLPHWFSDTCLVSEEDDEAEFYSYIDLIYELEYPGADEPDHAGQIGGWPPLIQGDMQIECQLASNGVDPGEQYADEPDPRIKSLTRGAQHWQMVVMLESVSELGWNWGDSGYLYYWARQEESKRSDFSGAWSMMATS